MSNGLLIGVSGRARVGKLTFFNLLRDIYREQLADETRVVHFAFAKALKAELDAQLIREFGISAFTTDTAQKTIIRPALVARGAGARKEDPNHWIKQIEPGVKDCLACGDLAVVEDVRYANEANWVHSLGGKVVYIERIQPDGQPVPPANDEEARQDPGARAASDLVISWPTVGDVNDLRPYVLEAWNRLTQPA